MSEVDGKIMSVYGKRDLGPTELLGSWKTLVRKITIKNKDHLATKGDDSGYWKGMQKYTGDELELMKTSYYGERTRKSEADVSRTYDRLFHPPSCYNSNMHRDDRKSIITLGIAVNDEESKRACPVLTSSEYGRRLYAPLEPFERERTRIDHTAKTFYYPRGTGLPPIRE